MFCIKCGKPAKVDNFCSECFLESEALFEARNTDMEFCDLCGIKEDEILKKAEATIKTNNTLLDKKIVLKTVGNKVHATITCTGKIKGLSKTETKNVMIILRRKMCEMHVRLSGGYYEAVIQIRGHDKEKILKKAGRLLPKKSIINVENLKEGYNIKIMHKANAAAAVRHLRQRFAVKDSYKLVGSKKGQKLYRNFYVVR